MIGQKGFWKWFWIILFLAPSLLGLITFLLIPMLASLGLTFFNWDPLLPTKFNFVGLKNYMDLTKDKIFWQSFVHTLYFIIGYIPFVLITGLSTALLMNRKLKFLSFFRGAYFLPVISAWVAVALIWAWVLNPQFGLVNYFLGLVGIKGPLWLFDPNWAMPAIIITSIWKDTGFVMIFYLAGLQNISNEYYEAASLDGASKWQQFKSITLPLLSPTTFMVLMISLINSFQVFEQVWIMTQGGPAGSTTVIVQQIVDHAFRYGRMSYAATLSWVLFAIIFAITMLQNKLQKVTAAYE
jgi:multiple sugar transport system permease protein